MSARRINEIILLHDGYIRTKYNTRAESNIEITTQTHMSIFRNVPVE